MNTTKNNIGVTVVNYHGKVVSIGDTVSELKNDKKTKFRMGATKIKYPNGGVAEVATRFYVNSIAKHPDTFKVGSKIGLEIQAEGEYAGRAVAKLHGETVDIAKLLGNITVSTVPADVATSKEVEVEA